MIFKGDKASGFAKRPDPATRLVLIYGEDEGVVADTAADLIRGWEKEGPCAVLTLDEDDIKREPVLLFDALEAMSLLGETTIVRIRVKGEKITQILQEVLALPAQRIAARVVVMSGALNTKSKLRTVFEKAGHASVLQMFADSDADIAAMVKATLDARGVAIEAAALSVFVGGLPGHRSLANAESEKLALYAHGLGRAVTVGDIRALCETNADEDMHDAVMHALSGDGRAAQAELDRVLEAGLSAIGLVRAFEREALRLLAAHDLIGSGVRGSDVGMKLKPPIWSNQWPAFKARLDRWPMPRLSRLLERLHDVERLAKTPGIGSAVADVAARDLFLALYGAAAGR